MLRMAPWADGARPIRGWQATTRAKTCSFLVAGWTQAGSLGLALVSIPSAITLAQRWTKTGWQATHTFTATLDLDGKM